MKQFFSLILLLSTTLQSYAQREEQITGSGNLIQLNPAVEAFSTLELSKMNVKVVIETGAQEYSVSVLIDDNLKPYFKLVQSGSTLKLSVDLDYMKTGKWLSTNNTVITIKAPFLESLINTGNTEIELNLAAQKNFSLQSKGNAEITLTGILTTFQLNSAGNATILLKGKAEMFQLLSSGNSTINASTFICETASIQSSGNADITVNAKTISKKNMAGNYEFSNKF